MRRSSFSEEEEEKRGWGKSSSSRSLGKTADPETLHFLEGKGGSSTSPNPDNINVGSSGGGGDISLREWLDREERCLDLPECLRIFKQIAAMICAAHDQGVVVQSIRPSCFVMSTFNRVSFIESASCSTSGSASDGCCDSPVRLYEEHSGAFRRRQQQSLEEGSENWKKTFPLKHILVMEFDWYVSPEESSTGAPSSFASDIYRLGVLLFELLCTSSSLEEKLRTMSNLRHRILPSQLLLTCPKEASFCLWLLHPQPLSRPKIREVLKSEFLNGPRDHLHDEHDTAIKFQKDVEEQELLLDFLLPLQKKTKVSADTLHATICCLSADIEEVLKKHSAFKGKDGLDMDQSGVEDLESCSSRSNVPEMLTGDNADADVDAVKKIETVKSKSVRLMSNFSKLEAAYFAARIRMKKASSNLVGSHGEWMNPFLDGLCKYLSFSELNVRADLKHGDLLNSSNLVCSLGFDRDRKLLATAGVNKRIKIFECDSILNEDCDMHYPVAEIRGTSKFSNLCWNGHVKSQIASSDFEGVVQVWDVTRSQVFADMREHEKRVWSVDFSSADPAKLASGSDDGTVKLWNINHAGSIGTIKTKANICSVQFSPDADRTLAVGSADHNIYCYDLRSLRTPSCTLLGHTKTVSYVKFVDPSTLVSASTDNTLKLWDLSSASRSRRVIDEPLQTFTGHTNMKNFVGLSTSDGFIATGSETNEVFVYYKAFSMPVLSFKFNATDPVPTPEFISSVCWQGQSSTLIAANSSGNIKILEMV